MRVFKNDQILTFGWKYESPSLLRKLKKAKLTELDAKNIMDARIQDENNPDNPKGRRAGVPALCKLLGIKQLPQPTVTWCLIKDQNKEIIATACVKKCSTDAFDAEKARVYSLTKVLHKVYPGKNDDTDGKLTVDHLKENREMRAKFWAAYLGRKDKQTVTAV